MMKIGINRSVRTSSSFAAAHTSGDSEFQSCICWLNVGQMALEYMSSSDWTGSKLSITWRDPMPDICVGIRALAFRTALADAADGARVQTVYASQHQFLSGALWVPAAGAVCAALLLRGGARWAAASV